MNAVVELRLPPHSVEAEQALLGSLMMDSRGWDRVADILSPADFYRDDHRRIFRHIAGLAEAGKVVDVITVDDSVRVSNEVEQVGGLGYLAELANAAPSAANILRYAEIVVEKAQLRSLEAFSADVQALAHASGKSVQDRIEEATAKLMAMAERSVAKTEPRPIADILGRVVADIDARREKGGAISGLSSGLADIDAKTDGLKAGDLFILAGRPSMGKTALALNIAENVALAGHPVLVFSLEMGDTQLVTRSLSSIGSIDSKLLASGRLSDDDWGRVSEAMGRLHKAPLIIDESPALSAGQMRARARRQKRKSGLSLIVIDYLQLMRGQGNNRNEELGDITRNLKLMARDLCVPVLCLSQLSRKCEERMDKRPMLSDLRESGAIEQDADVVAMMYRDDYYRQDSPYRGLAEVLIRKNRMGECGDVRLVFEPQFSRFRDADPSSLAIADSNARQARAPGRGFRGE